jgi:hypothetical protein
MVSGAVLLLPPYAVTAYTGTMFSWPLANRSEVGMVNEWEEVNLHCSRVLVNSNGLGEQLQHCK